MESAGTSISRVLTPLLLARRNSPGAWPRPAACFLGCRVWPGSALSTRPSHVLTNRSPSAKASPTSSSATWPVLARSRLCRQQTNAPSSPAPPPARRLQRRSANHHQSWAATRAQGFQIYPRRYSGAQGIYSQGELTPLLRPQPGIPSLLRPEHQQLSQPRGSTHGMS